MKINELAKTSGVTVRTLHYYDEIGLLKPSEKTESGYREYNERSAETLHQILFLRELDFSLSDIKEIINDSNFDKTMAFKLHKQLLIKKRDRLNDLISLCDRALKGEDYMDFKTFDMKEIEQHKKEAKERFGHTDEYKQSEQKTKNYNNNDWQKVKENTDEIFSKFAKIKHLSPNSEQAQTLVEEWKKFITDNFYDCTNEVLEGLSVIYTQDERFLKNIDKHGEGTAEFVASAIKYYCE